MILNDDQVQLINWAKADVESLDFDHQRDGHKLQPGTFAFVKGEPVTITADNGVWLAWVPGHVELHGGNNRSIVTL